MSVTRPAVSVIIPVYNVEKYLRRCLESVAAQTFADFEAICINDGSPDGCGEILAAFAARDARFRVVTKSNAGVSAARNDGLKIARGEYVMFLDADDFIHPQLLEITQKLASGCNADLVSFRFDKCAQRKMRRILRTGGDVLRYVPRSIKRVYDASRVRALCTTGLINYATERNHAIGRWRVRHCYPWMCILRREFISGMRFHTDIKLAEDFPWWTEILFRRPRAVITRLPLYQYAPNASSALTAASAKNVFDNMSRATIAAYKHGAAHGTRAEMNTWTREFLWPFIITIVRASRGFPGGNAAAREFFAGAERTGMLDLAPGPRARKYRRRILRLISKK